MSNAKIFDEPVYNYTHEFPYLCGRSGAGPIPDPGDRDDVDRVLLAGRHAVGSDELDAAAIDELKRRYFLERLGTQPRVYSWLTDNWLELTVRFAVRDRGILTELEAIGVGLAPATFEILGAPPLRVSAEANGADGSRRK